MLALLFGCGFHKSALLGLELDEIQMCQGHWAVVDLIGKGGDIRTVPIPQWVKAALDQWIVAARGREGSFEQLPGRERHGEKASRRMSCGTWSRVAARERARSSQDQVTSLWKHRVASECGVGNTDPIRYGHHIISNGKS